jgi:hypothetical protein
MGWDHLRNWRLAVVALAALVLSAGAACAQVTAPLPGYGGPDDYYYGPVWSVLPDYDQVRSPAQLERDREIERKYRETLDTKIADKKASNDPWRNIRPAPATKPLAPRQAAPRPVAPDRTRPE